MKFIRVFLLSASLLCQLSAAAEEEPPLPSKLQQELKTAETEGKDDAFADRFTQMLFYLGALVAVMYGGSWIIKKMLKERVVIRPKADSPVKVIEMQRLSLRTTLYIVDYKGQNLVVAESSNGQITVTKL